MFRFKCKYELKFAEIGVQNSMEVQKQEHTDGGLNNEIVKQGQNGLVFINSNSYASKQLGNLSCFGGFCNVIKGRGVFKLNNFSEI